MFTQNKLKTLQKKVIGLLCLSDVYLNIKIIFMSLSLVNTISLEDIILELIYLIISMVARNMEHYFKKMSLAT